MKFLFVLALASQLAFANGVIDLGPNVGGGGGGGSGNATSIQGTPVSTSSPIGGQVLQFNGTSDKWEPATVAGTGTVTSLSAGQGLLGGTITSSGTLSVDVGTSANKIVQLNSAALLPALDGSLLSNLNASRIGTRSIANSAPLDGQVVTWNASVAAWVPAAVPIFGTVTSVDASVPSILTISGNPITTSGTLAFGLSNQNANIVFAGPTSGSASAPTFRSLVAADIPALSYISALTGDVIATGPGSAAASVVGIQGTAVSATPPTAGQLLSYNGTSTQWEPSPAPVTTGAPNTFAGFDNSGALNPIPSWNWDNTTFGLSTFANTDPATLGNFTEHTFETSFDPSADTATSFNQIDMSSRYDDGGLNFSTTGNYNGVSMSQLHISGTGNVNFMRTFFTNQVAGDGSAAGSVGQLNNTDLVSGVGSGFTVTNGRNLFVQVNNSGTIAGDYDMFDINSNGNAIGGNHSGANFNLQAGAVGNKSGITISSSGDVGGQYSAISLNNTSNLGSTYNLISDNNTGTIGAYYNGLNFANQASGTIGHAYSAINFLNDATVTDDYSGLNLQNSSSATIGAGYNGVRIFNDAAVGGGYEGLSIHNTGTITNGSTMGDFFWNANGNNVHAIAINMQGTVTNEAHGIDVDMTSMVSGQQLVGISVDGASSNFNSSYDTSILTPAGEFQLNNLGGQMHVASGFPINGSFGFGNNLGIQFVVDDDIFPDNFLGSESIGFNINGFVNQLAIASGKTVNTLGFMIAGGSFPSQSTGGTITNLSMFRALGIVPAGGTLAITNEVQFLADQSADLGTPANLWGFRADSTNAENWFAKDVVVGGTSMVATNASVGIEIAGTTKALLLSRLATADKNALTAVAGMTVYDTDLSEFDCYSAGAWSACGGGGGGGGANQSLSNLTSPTAINQDLIFAFSGSPHTIRTGDGSPNSDNLLLQSGSATAGASGLASFSSGSAAGGSQSGTVTIFSGAQTDQTNSTGNVQVFSSDAGSTFASGSVVVQTGASVDGVSGTISMNSGNSSGAGNSGDINMSSGGAGASGQTGNLNIGSGINTGSSSSGALTLFTGASANSASGIISILSGATAGAGNSGEIDIDTGSPSGGGASGAISILTGQVTAAVLSGGITLATGGGVSTDGGSGDININTGNGLNAQNSGNITLHAGSTNTGNAGNVSLNAGASSGSNGGGVNITAGDSTGGGTGGSVGIVAGGNGAATGGGVAIETSNLSTGTPGDILFQPGTNNSNVAGNTIIAGHIITKDATGLGAPSVSSCGTSPSIVGSDSAGRVTIGTGGITTTCNITFTQAWTNTPLCFVSNESAPTVVEILPTTSAFAIISATPLVAGGSFAYHCLGYQ